MQIPGNSLTKLLFVITLAVVMQSATADTSGQKQLSTRIKSLLDALTFEPETSFIGKPAHTLQLGKSIRIEHCKHYPYHNQQSPVQGFVMLANDIREGLRIGLNGMAGLGPEGKVDPFHRQQAILLMDLIENQQVKTFRCVEDQTFAYAVAKPPPGHSVHSEYDRLLGNIPYPGIAFDTYRLSGFLTRKHEPSTYRDFFKLNDRQITEHLRIKPKRIEPLHRYNNLKALVFHEMVHWLGHSHTNMKPDVVDLYEICFFGGSDFISDPAINRRFQQRACNILGDAELWQADVLQQGRLWRKKGYDQLKPDMRALYD